MAEVAVLEKLCTLLRLYSYTRIRTSELATSCYLVAEVLVLEEALYTAQVVLVERRVLGQLRHAYLGVWWWVRACVWARG